MRVILKPLGVATMLGALTVLSAFAVRGALVGVHLPGNAATAVYDDRLQNNWAINGWASKIKSDDQSLYHSDHRSLRARIDHYLGVKFMHDPLDTAPYDRLCFFINGGPTGGQRLQVQALLSGKKTDTRILLDALPANRWVRVTIPLRDLKVDHKTDLSHFWVQDVSGQEQPDCFIDDIGFLAPGDPLPAGEALMTSAAPRENW